MTFIGKECLPDTILFVKGLERSGTITTYDVVIVLPLNETKICFCSEVIQLCPLKSTKGGPRGFV